MAQSERDKYQSYRDSGALERVRAAVEDLLEYEEDFLVDEEWWRHYLGFQPWTWFADEKSDDGEEILILREPFQLLKFSFNSTPGSLRIQLILHAYFDDPDEDNEAVREALLAYVWEHVPPFSPSRKTVQKTNNTLYSTGLLSGYPPDISKEEIAREVRVNWERFRSADLPALTTLLLAFEMP